MEKKNFEESVQVRIEAYLKKLEADPELKHIAEDLRQLTDREPEEIPDEVFEDPSVQEYIESIQEEPEQEGSDNMKYVTEKRVRKDTKIAELPEKLSTITHAQYRQSLNLLKEGKAWLQPLDLASGADKLTIEDGKIFFQGVPASEAQLRQLYTDEIPKDIDLTFLQLMYSIVLKNYDQTMTEDNTIRQVITLYMPAVMRALGQPTAKEHQFELFKQKILSFQTIMGVIDGMGTQAVLVFLAEDKKKNIISFSAPYLEAVVRNLYKVSIRRKNNGEPMLKKNGEPLMIPTDTYSIDPAILKEKCKYAILNVVNLVSLIKEAGENTPHITAKTLIDRNLQFKEALDNSAPKDRNIQLKRVFAKTWEMLPKYTTLKNDYPDIQLPDPKNPANIPTWKTRNMVFSFPKYKNTDETP